MEIQEISTSLMECVQTDDIVKARRLLAGVDEKDRKLIVAKRDNNNAPLFVAAMRGNVNMVEFLANECHANLEELGRYEDQVLECCYLVTPLWCAAASNKLEVLNRLLDLGADINAASDTGETPVLYACWKMNAIIAECLVRHGADVQRADNDGVTCLMNAVMWSKELCQILIDNGADVKAQDLSGNTALHCAITGQYLDNDDLVQLLIDRGSDPYLKNKDGDDAFLMASLIGEESIVKKLILKFKPPVKRRIESYEILGAFHVYRGPGPIDLEQVLLSWKTVVEMRRMHSCYDVDASQPHPVYGYTKEVNTVEELEALSQNRDFVYMHALMIYERILGPHHFTLHSALLLCGATYREDGKIRRCIDVWKYAFKLQNAGVEQLTNRHLRLRYISPMYLLCLVFCEAYLECQQPNNMSNFEIDFEDVFQVLQMATSRVDDVTGIVASQEFQNDETSQLIFIKLILHLMKLITELDKNEDQQLRFNKVIYRLLRCQPKTRKRQTLLHLSVKECTSEVDGRFFSRFPSIAVVELLLECGANVNAVDDEHNTALHLCSEAIRNLETKEHHDLINKIAVLLLKNLAHVDMVNMSGNRAADGLTCSLMDMNIHDFVSLKCLAARAIVKYKIQYVGRTLASLESFVQMHEICAPNGSMPA